MNSFLVYMPWRLAALAAIVVGIVSFAGSSDDTWSGLTRVGIAFAVFFMIGLAVRTLLSTNGNKPTSAPKSKLRSDGLSNGQLGMAANLPTDSLSGVASDDMNN